MPSQFPCPTNLLVQSLTKINDSTTRFWLCETVMVDTLNASGRGPIPCHLPLCQNLAAGKILRGKTNPGSSTSNNIRQFLKLPTALHQQLFWHILKASRNNLRKYFVSSTISFSYLSVLTAAAETIEPVTIPRKRVWSRILSCSRL